MSALKKLAATTGQVLALEAAAFKNNTLFHDKLTSLFAQVKDNGNDAEAFAKLGIPAAIFEATGISIKINIVEAHHANMGINIPQLDKNSAIVPEIRRSLSGSDTLVAIQKLGSSRFTFGVDREAGKVTGGLSKLTCIAVITTGMLNSEKYTPAKLSAAMFHELGHVYSYAERLTDLFTVNYAIYAAAEEMFKLPSLTDRVELLLEFDKYAGVVIPDKENVVNNTKDSVVTHLCCEMLKQRRNVEGDLTYSYRGFEQSSDQFVTRHGAGADLITVIDQIERDTWFNPSLMSWPLHVTVELLKASLYILQLIGTFQSHPALLIGPITIMLASRPMDKIYDEPHARMERVKRDMMAELKNNRLTEMRRQQVLNDLAFIEPILAAVNDKRTLWETIWAYVIPAGNESRKRMEFQQNLEKLTSNELYVASAMFAGK